MNRSIEEINKKAYEDGTMQEKKENAKKMKEEGVSIEIIEKVTGLNNEEI